MWGLMIVCYICIATTAILLLISGMQGYFQFKVLHASHPQFALLSTVFYMFTETLVMFYFIGSGSAIKKTISSLGIKTDGYEKVKKTKMLLFPHLTMNMVFVGLVFILGGAVQTGSVAGWIHGLLFDFAFFHFLYTTVLQHRGFKENVDIIGELFLVNDPTTNNSPV